MNKTNQKKYHIIYKTTNLLSGRYYLGMHSTDTLDDDYLGSGNQLHHAIKKHGRENFKREILEFCSSREELASRESELVTMNEVRNKECMNMKVGGFGGGMIWNEEHMKAFSKAGHSALKEKLKTDPELKQKFIDLGNASIKNLTPWTGQEFKGKKHTEETKKKMREAQKNRNSSGEYNSQHGTMWVTNETENLKINKNDSIPSGYRKGRKIKLDLENR